MKKFDFCESPLGRIGICEEEGKVCQVWLDERSGDERPVGAVRI